MEEILSNKINELKSAVQNFEESLGIDTSAFPENIRDAIESGRLQKFEFSTELLWKTIKRFLLEKDGVESISPKAVIKSYLENGYCSYDSYERMIRMIDDRNILSHIYKKEMAQGIASRFEENLKAMQDIIPVLEKNVKEGS